MKMLVVCAATLAFAVSACGSDAADDHAEPIDSAGESSASAASETYEPAVPPVDLGTQVPSTDQTTEPTKSLVPERTYSLDIGTHCGVAVLSRNVHDQRWTTDEADGATDWMPPEWLAEGPGAVLTVLVVLSTGQSHLTVTYNDRAVVYRPLTPRDPVTFCD